MPYVSFRANYRRGFGGEMLKRTRAAAVYLVSAVKADVSQPGTLRYHPRRAGGKFSKTKSQKTVYNFTHSRPGNPPYKQKGNLRASISYEILGLVARVGSNIKRPDYPLYLELGTRRMASRSYLRRGVRIHRAALVAILTKNIPSGGLPPIKSYQFRSGHFGRGAASAGW